jgi:hypothetical protein
LLVEPDDTIKLKLISSRNATFLNFNFIILILRSDFIGISNSSMKNENWKKKMRNWKLKIWKLKSFQFSISQFLFTTSIKPLFKIKMVIIHLICISVIFPRCDRVWNLRYVTAKQQ